MCATTSEPSGTATISQRRCLSRFSIRSPPRFTRRSSPALPALADPGHQQPDLLDGRRARVDLADDRALVHHGDPVGQRQHLVEVLADQEHRDLPRRGLAQVAVHGLDRADVEAARRRRGHEHPRLARELAREHDLLQVPARELAGRRERAGRLHVVAADHLDGAVANAPEAEERPGRRRCGTT